MILYIDPGTGGVIINLIITLIGYLFYSIQKVFYKKGGALREAHQIIGIFSEGNQYKNTFLPVVEELIKNEVSFNYFTLDYQDDILDIDSKYINSSFLGVGFMGHLNFKSISNTILLATTPNIGNKGYPLKRPKNVKELIHVWHSISDISYYKKGSLDLYDTILTVGDFQNESIKKIEKIRGLKTKKLIEVGLPYFDVLKNQIKKHDQVSDSVLIASSWGEKGLLKNYGAEILEIVRDYSVIIRPHPQSFISEKEFIDDFKLKCNQYPNITWDESNDLSLSFSKSFILISDTSSIRFDYSFLTSKPVITLEINESNLIDYELDLTVNSWSKQNQNSIGRVLKKNNLNQLNAEIENLKETDSFSQSINKMKKKYLCYEGSSAIKIVQYLIKSS
jgi:K+/H+ antiporter YhaU regulatory subunit KhtT